MPTEGLFIAGLLIIWVIVAVLGWRSLREREEINNKVFKTFLEYQGKHHSMKTGAVATPTPQPSQEVQG